MRQVLSGTAVDTTATVKAYLAAGNQFRFANLYLIGDLDDPQNYALTDWEAPLCWPIWGKADPITGIPTFYPSVIKRGAITSSIGLEVADLEVTWTPLLASPTQSLATASPYQLAQIGFFDNKIFRNWQTFMPTSGDANTYGAAAMFGGRIGKSVIDRGKIVFTVNSFLDVVNEMVPTNVIEATNTGAAYRGATPPPGVASIPQFATIVGSSPTRVLGDETSPTAHHIYADNSLAGGFIVFNGGAGSTLAGVIARIAANFGQIVGGINYNALTLYEALPWAPTTGVDTFYLSAAYPINKQDGSYEGFPFVPSPQNAL